MGLIANSLQDTRLKPFNPAGKITEANSFGYDPTLGAVNTGTDTVSGQLDAILGEKNTGTANLIQRARTNAANEVTQGMQGRGLLNSSMNLAGGIGAAEDAAYRVAVPIATQDANTFSTQRLTNQQASNNAGQFGAAAANQAGQFNANAGNQIVQQELSGKQNLGQIAAQGEQARSTLTQSGEQALKAIAATGAEESRIAAQKAQSDLAMQVQRASDEMRVQGLRGTQAEVLANIEGTYREYLQASAAAATMYTTIAKNINEKLSDDNLSPEDKQRAVDININMLEGGLAVISNAGGISPPLSTVLNF